MISSRRLLVVEQLLDDAALLDLRPLTVSPLSRCSACDSVGSIFTSHEQTVSRVARPKVVRK